ncbi:MAG: CAP domain-containing protein [Candidatus Sericytochromatia bacterium]
MIQRYATAFLFSAALAGCSAGTANQPAVPTALDAQAEPAAALAQEGPSRYVASPTNLAVSYMTASVNATTAARANDNSLTSYWESGAVTKPTFRVILKARAELTDLRIKLTPYVGTYTIETSDDARTWKVALTGQRNTTNYQETKRLPAGTMGMYLRLTFDNAGRNVRVHEIDVRGGASTTAPTPTPTATPIKTPTPAPTATPAPTTGTVDPMVQQVFTLVNQERAKVGAKPLVLSDAINKCAQFRSQDMATRNYFSHTDPDGNSPFYWLKQYGISYTTAGENIAMGQTSAASVMSGWMNSSGHKANILKTSYGKIGIGVAKNSAGRLYWTQLFTN